MTLRKSIALALFACLPVVLHAAAADAQVAQTEVNAPAIVTSGEATVRRPADRASVDVSVETRAKSPREAQSQNAEVMSTVQKQLRAANLPADAIRTQSFTVEAEYDFTNGRRVLRGFVARNSIEVRVDDLARLGEIVDRATNAGATAIGDVRFDLKDRRAAEQQALTQAVQDARARAEAMASAAGKSIQTIWRISDERVGFPVPRPMPMSARAMGAEAAPTPMAAGEIEIQAHVTLTALLK
ncbi:MAG: SIMPL domain-containing protein [Bacteroidales bacterium]